jgi:hypothetical protein
VVAGSAVFAAASDLSVVVAEARVEPPVQAGEAESAEDTGKEAEKKE